MTRRRALVLAQGADLVTFVVAVGVFGVGIHNEVNPVMRALFGFAGLAGPLALKVAGIALLAWQADRIRPVPLGRIGYLIAIGFGVIGAVSNVRAVLL